MPKNKCLFQAKSLDDPCYSQWLRKKSDEEHYAATAKAFMFLTVDIDVFIFTYLYTVQLCWKLWVLQILTH